MAFGDYYPDDAESLFGRMGKKNLDARVKMARQMESDDERLRLERLQKEAMSNAVLHSSPALREQINAKYNMFDPLVSSAQILAMLQGKTQLDTSNSLPTVVNNRRPNKVGTAGQAESKKSFTKEPSPPRPNPPKETDHDYKAANKEEDWQKTVRETQEKRLAESATGFGRARLKTKGPAYVPYKPLSPEESSRKLAEEARKRRTMSGFWR